MLKSTLRTAASICLAAAAATSALAQSVPGLKRDLEFDAIMTTIDLDDPSLHLVYKPPTNDGSSIGIYIGKGDGPTDASFVPTNTSSVPEAEVVSYRLARFLGVSRIYYPVSYYKLGPKATARFHEMVSDAHEEWDDRIVNRKMVLKELKASPHSILGIYRRKPKTKMYAADTLGMQGEFNLHSTLAPYIRAAGPMPDDRLMTLPGIKGGKPGSPSPPQEHQVELARELSTIFVIDQLLGQWDRFWENLEASGDRNGRLKLVARDNGGATLEDWEGYDTYARWVSRYDRDLIGQLSTLDAFLKGEAREFAGFTSAQAWTNAAGFISLSSVEVFRQKLSHLIEKRVPALMKRYGDATFFSAKSPGVAALDAADNCDED